MNVDTLAVLILPFFLFFLWLLFKWAKQFKKPSLLFPDLQSVTDLTPSLKKKLSHLPYLLLMASLASFLIAFIDPHYFTLKSGLNPPESKIPPTEGIAMYLLTDESGSMMEMINKTSKIDLLKSVTIPFIEKRRHDLIGLVAFARTADVRVPLTLDHKTVTDEILLLKPSILESDGGTAMGYAVYKTVNLIIATKHFANDLIKRGKPAYEIKNSVIILVTDGVQNVNPQDVNDPFRSMDISEAASYAKANNVRLYIINIDPSILTSKFTPERNLMKKVTELTGGHFYMVDGSNSLSSIYEDINQIEKSEIDSIPKSKADLPAFYRRVSFYPFFTFAGLLFLCFSLLLETAFFKRVP